MGKTATRVAEGIHSVARALTRVAPRGLLRNVEDRLFYVIFQRTRVENDAYGWRPPPAGGTAPPAGEAGRSGRTSAGDSGERG
jgi:hypothetical protein